MEHKITIEVLIKTDFLKEDMPKVHNFKINPEVINSLVRNLVKNLAKEFPKEKVKKSKTKKETKK